MVHCWQCHSPWHCPHWVCYLLWKCFALPHKIWPPYHPGSIILTPSIQMSSWNRNPHAITRRGSSMPGNFSFYLMFISHSYAPNCDHLNLLYFTLGYTVPLPTWHSISHTLLSSVPCSVSLAYDLTHVLLIPVVWLTLKLCKCISTWCNISYSPVNQSCNTLTQQLLSSFAIQSRTESRSYRHLTTLSSFISSNYWLDSWSY